MVKIDVANTISKEHTVSDEGIEKIIYFEDNKNEIKLLEINTHARGNGVEVFSFSRENPLPLKVIVLTPEEYLEIKFGSLLLPDDWLKCTRYVMFDKSI